MTEEHTNPPPAPAYPLRLEIDYPEGGRSRLTTAFRLVLVIPIAAVTTLLTGGAAQPTEIDSGADGWSAVVYAGGVVFLPALLMILFRRKYPRWWFDWNLELMRFSTRVAVYLFLLRDEYPSTDDQQAVHLDIDYPDAARDLNRWLPLIKWLLAIPHFLLLALLSVFGLVVTVIAWFAILITGRYPRGLFGFVVGVTRWSLRVQAYMLLLVTDRYPPFRLDP
ncbi:MAG: DUF4389 domain-containing protein [Acidobacteria bacterium]|nr:DUF4389 domain-containing protein [Acidobacteriota bacterium]MYD71062.1 DUF4389 domain-containing protein [Acidobacteriota bacterium]